MKSFTWYAAWWYQPIFSGIYKKKKIFKSVPNVTQNRPLQVQWKAFNWCHCKAFSTSTGTEANNEKMPCQMHVNWGTAHKFLPLHDHIVKTTKLNADSYPFAKVAKQRNILKIMWQIINRQFHHDNRNGQIMCLQC